ncbi:MAG: hypothetical protein HQK82_13405 [Desulfovibrionaceae bacterium]|nr:hypothetical protein [Desulfovibrionaceae bacterium]
MAIQYVTDAAGQKLAVLIPLEEWEIMASRLEYLDPNGGTVKAMQEGRDTSKLKAYTSPEALWADLEKE